MHVFVCMSILQHGLGYNRGNGPPPAHPTVGRLLLRQLLSSRQVIPTTRRSTLGDGAFSAAAARA